MKEFEGGLTRQPNNFTLKSEGRFMSNQPGVGEGQPIAEQRPTGQNDSNSPLWFKTAVAGQTEQPDTDWVQKEAEDLAREKGLDPKTLPTEVMGAFKKHIRERGHSLGAMNVPPGLFDPGQFTNLSLKDVANTINAVNRVDQRFLERRKETIEKLIESGGLIGPDIQEARDFLANITGLENSLAQQISRQGQEERFGFYLQPKDIEILREPGGPIKWLDTQFDVLYRSVQQGQELNAPVVNNLQTVASEAIRYLTYNFDPKVLDEFQTQFTIRFHLMSMRVAISYRTGVDQVKQQALSLGAHGLFEGFAMQDGKVGEVFNRFCELLDDQRRATGKTNHITPEIANNLQDKVIQEQENLARKGIGPFASDEAGIRTANIIRSVRLAYDVFVSSQRQAVIVARGRHLTSNEAYFSDPASGILNVYNLEDLLTQKFGFFSVYDDEFLRRIKLDMARESIKKNKKDHPEYGNLSEKEKLDLGTRLFRDIFAVPDFFTSGWRIQGLLGALEERLVARFGEREGKERAKQMALFMRLKSSYTKKDYKTEEWQDDRKEVWENIAKFRPEEIVGLFRERAGNDSRLTDLFRNDVFVRNNVTGYDQFKNKYGIIIRHLREKGYKDFKQLNIGGNGFSQEEKNDIARYFDGDQRVANELIEMYKLMTVFGQDSIEDLIHGNKFEDIYTRTINVDDALLSELEKTELTYRDENGNLITKRGFTPLSQKYAADHGGDALVRIWSDTEQAVNGAKGLVNYIRDQEKKPDNAIAFAEAISQYNGLSGRAKCIRFTIGTFLALSKKDLFWDAAALEKLPFRLPMSEIEKIYGTAAKPMGRDEILDQIDKINTLLVAALHTKAREGELSPEDFKKELEKAHEMKKDLREVAEVTALDIAKTKTLGVLLFLILAVIAEGGRTVASAVKQK